MNGFLKRWTTPLALVATLVIGAAFAQGGTKGGNLVIAMNGNSEPASLDGQIDPYDSTDIIDTLVSDHLVWLNLKDGTPEPFLATGWQVSSDGSTWTFHLRQGVQFQDGTPFNAEAVKFNLDRIMNPANGSAQAASDLGPLESTDVTGPYTVVLHYKHPWNSLLNALAHIPMWSPTALKKYPKGEFDQHLVGTGPFKLEQWIPKDHVTFVRWNAYNWGPPGMNHKGPVYLHSVTFKFISEQLVRGTILNTPNADMVWDLPAQYYSRYSGNSTYKEIKTFQPGTGLQYVMNTTRPPLNSLKVRQAIRYAVDPVALNKLVYHGLYLPTYGPLNSVSPCYNPAVKSQFSYNPEKADSLLSEAGWKRTGNGVRKAEGVAGVPDGTPLDVTWVALSRQSLGEVLQAQLQQVGIDLKLKIVPGPVQLQMAQNKTYGLMYERQRTPSPFVLYQVWYSKNDVPGGWAWTGFSDPKLDPILEDIVTAPTAAKACSYAKEAQPIINKNAVQLPTLSEAMIFALKDTVKGFQIGKTQGERFYLYNTYVSK